MIDRIRLVLILLAFLAGIASALNVGAIGITSVTVGSGASFGALLLVVAFLQLLASIAVVAARNSFSAGALVVVSAPVAVFELASAQVAHSIKDFSGTIALVVSASLLLIFVGPLVISRLRQE